jgi:hypothetical protein
MRKEGGLMILKNERRPEDLVKDSLRERSFRSIIESLSDSERIQIENLARRNSMPFEQAIELLVA